MSERARRNRRDRGLNFQTGHASRQGAAHLKDGTPNQDSVVVAMPSAGRLGSVAVMAVSDGAGGPILPVWLPGRLRRWRGPPDRSAQSESRHCGQGASPAQRFAARRPQREAERAGDGKRIAPSIGAG